MVFFNSLLGVLLIFCQAPRMRGSAGEHFLVETEDTAESDERGSAGSNDYALKKSKKYKKRTKGNLYDIDSDIFHHYPQLHISLNKTILK